MRKAIIATVLSAGLLIFLQSCKQKENNWDNQQALLETITNNIRYYQSERADKIRALEESLLDYKRSRASYWKEVADKINSQLNPIESLIKDLGQSERPDKDRLASVYTLICQYRDSVFKTDPDLAAAFMESMAKLTGQNGQMPPNKEDFYRFYFADENTTSKRIQLAKIHCDVLNMNNRILAYCNQKSMAGCILTFDSHAEIVGMNTTVTPPGGKIKIMAGVGAFSHTAAPTIWIGGKQVPLNNAAYAEKTITAPFNPGNYHIPVVMHYMNLITGKMDTVIHDLEYKVTMVCDN